MSNPLTDGMDQRAALGIYRVVDGSLTCPYLDDSLTSASGYRMRFCSATDADLLGDESPVLVVGGFRNEGFASDTDAGELSSDGNMIQLMGWDAEGNAYAPIWESPQEDVPGIGDQISLSTTMMEPAAMAAGRLHAANMSERVFL